MRRRATLKTVVLLAVSVASVAVAVQPFHDGTYGRISHSSESDDRDGIQLTLHLTPKVATVDFLMCEGGCDAVVKTRAVPVGDRLDFDITERFVDTQGRPTSSVTTHYVIKPSGPGLKLSASGGRTFSNVYMPPVRRSAS